MTFEDYTIKRNQEIIAQAYYEKYTKRKRKPPKIKPIRYPIAIEKGYLKSLYEIIKQLFNNSAQLIDYIQKAKDELSTRSDDAAEDLNEALLSAVSKIDDNIKDYNLLTENVGYQVNTYNRTANIKQMRDYVGVSTISYEPWVKKEIRKFSNENIALIRSIKTRALDDISKLAQRAIREGMRYEEIRDRIKKIYGNSEYNARRIARDQVAKLNSNLTRLRQEDAGFKSYEWATVGDERVRPTHALNDGKIFKYSNPPKETGNPGDDIQCRCNALPYFRDMPGFEDIEI